MYVKSDFTLKIVNLESEMPEPISDEHIWCKLQISKFYEYNTFVL